MAVDPSVRIDIAAEFTGRKAFKQADTSTAQLSKNVKNLAKTFGVAFSTAKVLAYAKASVKAAAEDQKAQQQLALALKNVGLGRDAATAEGYIQRIEKEFGIIDDKLRPAYTKLAIATRDTAETERLMGIAMDISANTGKDLESVTAALSKAYLGNNATLSKLGIGISKADLKTKSFKEITDQLAVTFAGAAKTSADSFAGSMDKLAIASNNAKEIIGTALIGALQSLGEDDSMATLAGNIEGASTSLANFIDSVVYLKEQIKSIPGAGIFGYLFSGVTDLLGRFSPQRLAELIKEIKGFQGMGNVAMTGGSNMDTQKFEAQQKKLAANKIKADKLAAANKIKADKLAAANKLKLDKAAAVFDLQKISIAAALKGKISDEERTRLLLMQAIEEGNADKAETLSKKLEEIQKKNEAIAKSLMEIGQAKDPFSTWAGSLTAALLELNKVGEKMFAIRQRESGFVDTSILGAGGGTTFPKDATPAEIIAIVETAVVAAETAATEAAASVEATQTVTEALAKSADAAVAVAETLGIIDTANVLGVNADIATQTQSSSIFNPLAGMTTQSVAAARAADLIASGSNAGAGTSSSMFNPYGTTPGSSAGFGNSVPYVYVTVNNNGSVIMQDDFVDAVNNAILEADRTGYGRTPAGRIAI
jgi:hypothetical protein